MCLVHIFYSLFCFLSVVVVIVVVTVFLFLFLTFLHSLNGAREAMFLRGLLFPGTVKHCSTLVPKRGPQLRQAALEMAQQR